MKIISTVILTLVVLMSATACMEGPAGPQGLAGPTYSGEMYDDCRDAFNSFSEAALRQMLASEWDRAELGELAALTDNDLRGMLKFACLVMASGADLPWGDLLAD